MDWLEIAEHLARLLAVLWFLWMHFRIQLDTLKATESIERMVAGHLLSLEEEDD